MSNEKSELEVIINGINNTLNDLEADVKKQILNKIKKEIKGYDKTLVEEIDNQELEDVQTTIINKLKDKLPTGEEDTEKFKSLLEEIKKKVNESPTFWEKIVYFLQKHKDAIFAIGAIVGMGFIGVLLHCAFNSWLFTLLYFVFVLLVVQEVLHTL